MNLSNIEEHKWYREILYCPSQHYYYFTEPVSRRRFCIYLRWRHGGNYTSQLIECGDNSDWEFFPYESWNYLPNSGYNEDHYEELEVEIIETVKKMFPNVIFPGNPEIDDRTMDIADLM